MLFTGNHTDENAEKILSKKREGKLFCEQTTFPKGPADAQVYTIDVVTYDVIGKDSIGYRISLPNSICE